MNLYLHIGTEKTGSSYLQSLAGVNREILANQGFLFPHAGKLERRLLEGHISGGNGHWVTSALQINDLDQLQKFLKSSRTEAINANCKNLLLSHEMLILELANASKCQNLLKVAEKVGFTKVYFLLVIRDPVDQALSLFRHRAKGGNVKSLSTWLDTGYNYGQALLSFLQATKELNLNLKCRKYSPSPGFIDKVFFKEWLGINPELKMPPRNRVNPSLTSSELDLLKSISKRSKAHASLFYEEMLMIPQEEKAIDRELQEYEEAVCANFLNQFKETWEVCNSFLSENESINIPVHHRVPIDKPDSAVFSKIQYERIAEYITRRDSFNFMVKLSWMKVKKILRNIGSKLIKANDH